MDKDKINNAKLEPKDIPLIEAKIIQGVPLTEEERKYYDSHFNEIINKYENENEQNNNNVKENEKIITDNIDSLLKEFGVDINNLK